MTGYRSKFHLPLAYKFPLLETIVVLAHQETEKCKLKFTQDFRLAKNKKKLIQSNEAVTDFRDGLRYYNIIVLFNLNENQISFLDSV